MVLDKHFLSQPALISDNMAGDDPLPAVKPPASGSHNKAVPMPRQLREAETFQEISQWDVSIRNFYRKDEVFYPFVSPKLKWDANKEDYNLNKEHDDSKLKRDKDELAQDLESFLQILAGYVPGDHLRLTIVKETKSYEDVIRIIREFYDAEIGVETELDFMKIERKSQEPHRMFYERLSAHVREHLVGPNKTVGSVSSGMSGDQMTLSLQNLVVKIFLNKISPKLADIVRKEYGPVMKSGKLLCELVPDICRNIDNLLQREASSVNLVQSEAANIKQVTESLPDLTELSVEELDERENEAVNTIKRTFGDYRKNNRGGFRGRGAQRYQSGGYQGGGHRSGGYDQSLE